MNLKGLISLSFGTLSYGMTEFVAMGLLPYVAAAFSVSLPQAGNFISAYATGVAFGAVALLWLRAFELKRLLLIMMSVQVAGNILVCLSPSFHAILAARFISGLPHGCYFGIATIVAQRIASKDRGSSAVSIMIAGMTIANIFGVPMGTSLAHSLDFRIVFAFTALWGAVVVFSIWRWVPEVGTVEDTGFRGQFAFLKSPAPYLVLLAVFAGNGGILCMLSYISPIMTKLAGLPLEAVPAVLLANGIMMMICNFVSGRLCDRFTPGIIGCLAQAVAVLSLVGIALFGQFAPAAVVFACIACGMLFAISAPEQVSILRVAPGGLMLASSLVQVAFNLGNAFGAFAGGIPLRLGAPLPWVPAIGAFVSFFGAAALFIYWRRYEKLFSKEIH
jgi:DHA1 family arabinose polymer transporter-like MFS transporter